MTKPTTKLRRPTASFCMPAGYWDLFVKEMRALPAEARDRLLMKDFLSDGKPLP